MPIWLLLLEAAWVAAFVGLGCKVWLLGVDMMENRLPEAPSYWYFTWRRRTPYPEELNEAGRIARRQYHRLLWICLANMIAGGFLFNFAKSFTH